MRCLPLCILLLAVAVLVVATSLDLWTSPYLWEEGDLAANALQVERAREGRELLGPYSRHGFNHPGPVSFYIQAWTEPLFAPFPSHLARHFAAQLCLNLATCLATLCLLRRGGALPTTVTGGTFLLIGPAIFLAGGNAIMLMSVWGPTMTILPMALAVVAAARLSDGDLAALPLAAMAAVVSAHNHVLTLPALALLTVAVVFSRVRHKRRLEPAPGSFRGRLLVLSSVAVLVAGAAPIVIEQLTGSPGNLSLMARWLAAQSPTSHPWLDVLTTFGQAFTDPLVVLVPGAAARIAGPTGTAVVIGLCLAAGIWVDRFRPRPWRPVLRLVWPVIALTALLARGAAGPLETYLFYYLYGLVGLLHVATLDGVTWLLLGRKAEPGPRAAAAVAVAGLVCLGAWLSQHAVAAPPPRDEVGDLIASLRLQPGDTVVISLGSGPGDENLWSRVPAYALRLRRAGCRVVVPERVVVMCGREMAGPPARPADVELEFSCVPPGPGSSRYVAHGDWGIYCRGPRADAPD